MPLMHGLEELRKQGRMTWIEAEHGWSAALEDIVDALSKNGFEECKRETTTSRRDLRPAGGVWQGVNAVTGSVASAIWVGLCGREPPCSSRSTGSRSGTTWSAALSVIRTGTTAVRADRAAKRAAGPRTPQPDDTLTGAGRQRLGTVSEAPASRSHEGRT